MDYKTIRHEGVDEFIEKKSRFIGYISPVKTEQEAQEFISKIKSKHWDATHNVYAYILRENSIRRYSDDGEPQGTAGVPVLDVLQKEEIFDACVVVTRYFGGTMLGAGGLVRAYSKGAKIAVLAGEICNIMQCDEITIDCDYGRYGLVSKIIPKYKIKIKNSEFLENVKLSLIVALSDSEKFITEIVDATAGDIIPQKNGTVFFDME